MERPILGVDFLGLWNNRGQDAATANNVVIHAYVLMTNDVHMLATPGDAWASPG